MNKGLTPAHHVGSVVLFMCTEVGSRIDGINRLSAHGRFSADKKNNSRTDNKMHVGRLIESIVRSQGRSPSWVAQQLHMVRVNVYDIFRRESVDSNLLQRLSIILDVDLFKILSDDLSQAKSQHPQE